jgi:hypothetical protein
MDTITIEGTTAWCNPFEPNKEYEKLHGVYDVAIVVEQERAAKLCEYLDELAHKKLDQAIKEAPENKRKQLSESLSIAKAGSPAKDKDGNDTGDILIKAKLKPVVQKKDGTFFTQKTTVFDGKLNPIVDSIKIGRGSHVKIVVEPYPYVMQNTKQVGVSLRFWKLQVLQLAEETEDTGGLEAVDGGYEHKAITKDNKKEADFEEGTSVTPQENANDERDF